MKCPLTWCAYLKMSNLGDIPDFAGAGHIMCSKSVKERLYLTLRPHLEYGAAAWNPRVELVMYNTVRS